MYELIVEQQPDTDLLDLLEQKIDEFNAEHWEVKQRFPLAVSVKDEAGALLAGAAGRTFGKWLLLDNLWVSPELRGQRMGQQLLLKLEEAACERGCEFVLLDTLGFQARPFYESNGYQMQWTQAQYPSTGCKYFMTKSLLDVSA
ncbi:GNAT family N-acetyltransferase [Vogesella alkaliphila]|uniref:N-acetyltransferase GCN5 n=1 Tax=Vogesella alkaliphila TaxID=1193621 RepID=A0ABQ2YFG1_9NEIS|nr:GNAT family N-acetyltransferase [Vogesella alkaliphila]GGX81952.1 N-acetyltransferase GCN5 [Vogesella alkaliphila]